MFENISYQEIHRTIIYQMVYIRTQDFEVIFMYLSLTLHKSLKTLSTTFLISHPFLLHWSIEMIGGFMPSAKSAVILLSATLNPLITVPPKVQLAGGGRKEETLLSSAMILSLDFHPYTSLLSCMLSLHRSPSSFPYATL